jgi:hypothetical protein
LQEPAGLYEENENQEQAPLTESIDCQTEGRNILDRDPGRNDRSAKQARGNGSGYIPSKNARVHGSLLNI